MNKRQIIQDIEAWLNQVWASQDNKCAHCGSPGDVMDSVDINWGEEDGESIFVCQPCAAPVLAEEAAAFVAAAKVGFDWDADTLWLLEDNHCFWCGRPNGLIYTHENGKQSLYYLWRLHRQGQEGGGVMPTKKMRIKFIDPGEKPTKKDLRDQVHRPG